MINVIITSDPRYKVNKAAIQSAVISVLRNHNVASQVEVEVNIIGDRKMHEFNKRFRGLDSSTDILTFALEDPNPQNLQHVPRFGFVASPDRLLRLGSIMISYPQALQDASLDGTSVEDEIAFLVEHGTNHLLGIHHS